MCFLVLSTQSIYFCTVFFQVLCMSSIKWQHDWEVQTYDSLTDNKRTEVTLLLTLLHNTFPENKYDMSEITIRLI